MGQKVNGVSRRSLKRDWFGVVRGKCKVCVSGSCESFQPSYQGSQAPQRLFQRAVEEEDNDLMEFALRWSSFPPGKYCTTCGCESGCHETEEEFAKRLRVEAILK